MVPAQLIGIKFNLLTALISLTLRWIWIVVDQELIFASELRCCCCCIFDRSAGNRIVTTSVLSVYLTDGKTTK